MIDLSRVSAQVDPPMRRWRYPFIEPFYKVGELYDHIFIIFSTYAYTLDFSLNAIERISSGAEPHRVARNLVWPVRRAAQKIAKLCLSFQIFLNFGGAVRFGPTPVLANLRLENVKILNNYLSTRICKLYCTTYTIQLIQILSLTYEGFPRLHRLTKLTVMQIKSNKLKKVPRLPNTIETLTLEDNSFEGKFSSPYFRRMKKLRNLLGFFVNSQ